MTADRQTGVRINKFLADSGRCSRREADQLVAAGTVLIDGSVAQAGTRVLPGQTVTVAGEPVMQNTDLVYLILYKPVGITCTTDTRRRDNIIDYLDYPLRVFPIGRLDRDSEGLIFLTNDGDIVNRILRAENHHEKEYRVTVDKPVTKEFLQQMASGVPILNTVTRPCRVTAESKFNFRIILTQGLNRQIRRMCEACGYEVKRLVRTRIMHITIGSMKSGQWRPFTFYELSELKRLLGPSKS
jgi:23S rRNA pseudouridine2604 synthase